MPEKIHCSALRVFAHDSKAAGLLGVLLVPDASLETNLMREKVAHCALVAVEWVLGPVIATYSSYMWLVEGICVGVVLHPLYPHDGYPLYLLSTHCIRWKTRR